MNEFPKLVFSGEFRDLRAFEKEKSRSGTNSVSFGFGKESLRLAYWNCGGTNSEPFSSASVNPKTKNYVGLR
jgi:hypothetical protein